MGAYRHGGDHAMLRADLARILPDHVAAAVLALRLPRPAMLHPVEAAAMRRTVPEGVSAFAAARAAATLGRRARRIFCAGEAISKAICFRMLRVIGFHDLAVDPGCPAQSRVPAGGWVLCISSGQDSAFRMAS